MNKPVHIDIAELEKGARGAFEELFSSMRKTAPDADALANLDVQELFVDVQIQCSIAMAKAIMQGHEPVRIAVSLGNCLGSTIADFSRNVDTSGRLADALYGHMRRAIRASMTDSCEVDCHTASFHVPITEGGSA